MSYHRKHRKRKRYSYKGKRCSKGELKIAKILEELSIEFEREKTFEDCVSEKNNKLRFDFFLPKYNILIEFQGHHHFHPINRYRRARIVHEKTVKHDKIKRQFAQDNKYILYEIHHKEYDNLEETITNFLGEIL